MIVWLIGLSGAGKSSVGTALVEQWPASRRRPVLVDGDDVRRMAAESGDETGHGIDDRRRDARRTIALCEWLAGQGADVVVCQVTLFEDLRAAHRARVDEYFEVFLDAPLDVVAERDPIGRYAEADAGGCHDVVGIDLPFPRPTRPDLVLDASGAAGGPAGLAAHVVRSIPWPGQPDYLHAPDDYLEIRPHYEDASSDTATVRSWEASRATTRSRLRLPPPEGREIHDLLDDLLPGVVEGEPLARDLVDVVVQRFEAAKRLYDVYEGPDLRGATDTSYRELTRYVRFGELLVQAVQRWSILPHLNALLKVCDLLSAHQDEIPIGWRERAADVLGAERTLVLDRQPAISGTTR